MLRIANQVEVSPSWWETIPSGFWALLGVGVTVIATWILDRSRGKREKHESRRLEKRDAYAALIEGYRLASTEISRVSPWGSTVSLVAGAPSSPSRDGALGGLIKAHALVLLVGSSEVRRLSAKLVDYMNLRYDVAIGQSTKGSLEDPLESLLTIMRKEIEAD